MTAPRPLAIGLTPMETRREVITHLAVRADQLGYAGFFLGEGWGHDAPVLLAEIALKTSRIRMGTGVLNVWGRSPASIAMLAASLDEISHGRFDLGLGAGSPQLAQGWHDVPFRSPVSQLGSVTRQVRRLLDGERLEPTATSTVRPLRSALPPSPRIPIHLAALGPDAVRLCGELADAWYPFLLPRSGMEAGTHWLAEGAARRSPNRRAPQIHPGVPVAVAPSVNQARRLASWWVTFYLTSMGPLYARTLREHGLGEEVDTVLAANRPLRAATIPDSPQRLLDELVIWGEPDAARSALDRWYASGADMPILVLPPNRPITELDAALETLSAGHDRLS
jgi:alkanesulfonate monooxygenase SsuD/methylene tetrahydromethanopterin reductase-like flavin-dependent oxidoreductase (luciferase family)